MKPTWLFCVTLFYVFLILPSPSRADELTGRVVAVADGDTLTILTDTKRQIKIRLAEIDTPESKQPYGSKAKQELSALVFDKQVNVIVKTTDKYGRSVGRVYTGNVDVNAEMVRKGAAWVYRQYATDKNLFALEQQAKENKTGLWSLPEAQRMPPWQWRHANRENYQFNDAKKEDKHLPTDKRCGSKNTCKQMQSCAEAEFYLETCGVSSLDRNDDGVPCESLCK